MSLLQASTRGLPALTVALRRRRRTGTKRVRLSRRPASQSKYGSLISESRSHRLTLFAPGGGERSTGKQTNNNKKVRGGGIMGTGILCLAPASGTKGVPASHAAIGGPYVAHLSHDGLLLLAEVVLVVLGHLLVQVLVHLQDLSGRETQTSGEMPRRQLRDFRSKANLVALRF